MNLTTFQNVDLEIVTMTPPLAKDVDVSTFCDPDTGVIISTWNSGVYAYNYDLLVFEERFNK